MTIEAVLAPTSRMFRRLITKARPVPSAPSSSTLTTTSSDSRVGTGGGPAKIGASTASCRIAISSWAVVIDTPESVRPATNRFWYGMATP
ncbi:hypothetical protein GCM10027605_03610 [Micromonospora zhanjiangensis]